MKEEEKSDTPTTNSKVSRLQTFSSRTNELCSHVFISGCTPNGEKRLLPSLEQSLEGKRIYQITSGNDHILALSKSGSLWVMGLDGPATGLSTVPTTKQFHQIKSDQVFRFVIAGSAHSFASNVRDEIYGWGFNDHGQLGFKGLRVVEIPTLLTSFPQGLGVQKIACGNTHTVILTNFQDVWTWGRADGGRLGHGETTSLLVPKRLEALDNLQILNISCGWNYTMCSSKNEIYTFGLNQEGQLGHGDRLNRTVPTKVEFLCGAHVHYISAGCYHSLALTDEGLYVWGWNERGQLGLGDRQDRLFPTLLDQFEGDVVQFSSCGSFHTAALCQSGAVYTWGEGKSGRLGHGNELTIDTPQRVTALDNMVVSSLVCGFYHTAFITTDLIEGPN